MGRIAYHSWGLRPSSAQAGLRLWWRSDDLPTTCLDPPANGVIPFGNGRSYGDVCLNRGGWVLDCRGLDRFIAFDQETGRLRCEAGVLLSDIVAFAQPRGWFFSVTPGTAFVTVGGAIANDVHGKNHHRAGTFGRYVDRFELLRSDGTRLLCSPNENPEWFRATVGGLGLTGLITWVELRLRPIASPFIDQEVVPLGSLSEFQTLAEESDEAFEYTVAWIDGLARGAAVGRGLVFRGNHSDGGSLTVGMSSGFHPSVPFTPPFPVVNRWGLRLFNACHRWRNLASRGVHRALIHRFFYPLDGVKEWNRAYGPGGFFQYQCVLPEGDAEAAVREILGRVSEAREGPCLVVLKRFGDLPSPGLLSFPRRGITLALDLPNRGRATLELLDRLDAVTMACGGAVNPAKDGRMGPEVFQASFPAWRSLLAFKDPAFSSSFWRRVTERGKES